MLGIDQILVELEKITILKEAFKFLILQKIYDLSHDKYKKIRERIQLIHAEKKYYFVPDKKEAVVLEKLEVNADYQTILSLIPNCKYIDVIRTGLLIKSYHEHPTKENGLREKEIKTQLNKRPNGKKLLNLVRLVTAPYFSVVINDLYRLKREGYSELLLLDELDETIDEWNDTHLPVKASNSINEIVRFCKAQVQKKRKKFFLLGIKTACEKLERAMDKLEKQQYFVNQGYKKSMSYEEEGLDPRLEVTIRLISDC